MKARGCQLILAISHFSPWPCQDQVLGFIRDIFSFKKVRFTEVESLAADILKLAEIQSELASDRLRPNSPDVTPVASVHMMWGEVCPWWQLQVKMMERERHERLKFLHLLICVCLQTRWSVLMGHCEVFTLILLFSLPWWKLIDLP